jgi:hypothetical protein
MKSFGKNCIKCNQQLIYFEPSMSFSHCGTDYWTRYGERRWKPQICMACRTKVGRNAQKAQNSAANASYKSSLQSTQKQITLED